MAGDWHELVAKLILDNPNLAWELYEVGRERVIPVCTDAWHQADSGRGRPVKTEVHTEAETRAESVGAPIMRERRTDRIVELGFRDGSKTMVICEVQTSWSDEKARRLPGYVARVHEDYDTPVELLMICKKDKLASRYREGLWLGPHSVVTPVAVGPSDLARIFDAEAEGQSPQMTVLTLLMQPLPESRKELKQLVSVLSTQLAAIDMERSSDYTYYLNRLKGEELMVVMEEIVSREADPEWWRRAKARMAGEGRDEALAEGLERGMVRGMELGAEKARAKALVRERTILFNVLDRLGIEAGEAARTRIETCDDPDLLANWVTRALKASDIDEVFGGR